MKKSPGVGPGALKFQLSGFRSALTAGQNTEERLDVSVRTGVTIDVEVSGALAGRRGAVARKAQEERLDIGVGPGVRVTVEVRRSAVALEGRARAVADGRGRDV